MDPPIAVSKLTKRYGKTLAVSDVTFNVHAREVVGFLGPNGAGKSTTLRILAGFLGRTSGSVRIGGLDLDDQPIEAKKMLGYMAETVPLYPEMRVAEYLRFRAELKGVPRSRRRSAVDEAMEKTHVDDVRDTLIGRLSRGYRQRVGLADALVAKPPILVLDEPTAGLDPNQIREMRDLIRELGREHAILFSTHILSEVEATCDRVLVLGKGKLLAQGSMTEVRGLATPHAVEVTLRGDRESVISAVRDLTDIEVVEVKSESESAVGNVLVLSCSFTKGANASLASEALHEALVAAGAKIRELRPVGGGLEDVFAELTRAENETKSGASS
jgi:ABC-2 type transport system ATP-binding protein